MRSHILVLEGTLELLSPVLIGGGVNDTTDADVLLNGDGVPFIPATSFLGALRHCLDEWIDDTNYTDLKEQIWGGVNDDGSTSCPSSLACSDLTPTSEAKITIRDGIRIDPETGQVFFDSKTKAGAKFDYQVLERGTRFNLRLEMDIHQKKEEEKLEPFLRFMATLRKLLRDGQLRLGARTGKGLGRVKLFEDQIYFYDFSKKSDVYSWLSGKEKERETKFPEPFKEKSPYNFELTGEFDLKTSFLSRSYSAQPQTPDVESIRSAEAFVITGSSLRGAIRARADKILETIGKKEKERTEMLESLFGYVSEKKDASKPARKGRIFIEETILPDRYPSEVQTRIQIDRFTGGTVSGAFLEEMPVFSSENEGDPIKIEMIKIEIKIKGCSEEEAGLMTLILKDLWTRDLTVGGGKAVGRGVFQGKSAHIQYQKEPVKPEVRSERCNKPGISDIQYPKESVELKGENGSISFSDPNPLQGWIDALNGKKEESKDDDRN